MKLISVLFLCGFLWIVGSSAMAQSPGLVIQTGLSAGYSKDSKVTKGGEAHYGWMIGADARLLEGDIYFLVGGQYHSTSLQSTSNLKFFKDKDWTVIMGRLGLGFNLFHLSDRMSVRSKILGSINFSQESPRNGLNIDGYEVVNDSFMGTTTGLGLTFGSLDLDIEYQYGFINAFYQQPKSTFDFWTICFGFHF
jgi:hypothetical protein